MTTTFHDILAIGAKYVTTADHRCILRWPYESYELSEHGFPLEHRQQHVTWYEF